MSVSNVNEVASELQSAADEPLHITAVLAKLAELRDTFHLPHPAAVRMEKSNGIGVVEVASFAEVVVWANALGATRDPISHAHEGGASSHAVWVRWHGWDVKVGAWIDAPPSPVLERTIFTHCNWIGGCDTPLTAADGSMLCPLHCAAPLSEAMGHYERELRGGAR